MTTNSAADIEPSGSLLQNLLLFGRILRSAGIEITPDRMITFVLALEHINIGRRIDFYNAARCTLIHHRDDIDSFDWAFELFWQQASRAQAPIPVSQRQKHPLRLEDSIPHPAKETPSTVSQPEASDLEQQEREFADRAKTYSDAEILRAKDFSDLSEVELQLIKKLIHSLVWKLGSRKTRRFRPGSGHRIDLRRSLRHSLRYGGEFLEWPTRLPNQKHRPLVVIADISGSMDRYSRILLHFIYTLTEGLVQPVEAFVFSTRLTRISKQLQVSDVDRAMADVAKAVPDWSGGTRIGEALREFNFSWSRRVLGRGATVLLISDGWDRGNIDLLTSEMARLQRSCFRLIWLNPLLGLQEYEPLTRGMAAALPYVDDFLPVHNLTSLEALAKHLYQLDTRRPNRRQQISVKIPMLDPL